MVGIGADHHIDFGIKSIEHVRVQVQEIAADAILIQDEGVLEVLETNFRLAVCDV